MDNGWQWASWRLCFNLYDLNYYGQMRDSWDNISTYKTTAAERNWLLVETTTQNGGMGVLLEFNPPPYFQVMYHCPPNNQYVLNQSLTHSSTFTLFILIHCSAWWSKISIWEARPPKCTTGCTMGAAATMLRESEFNVSGGRSCMKPLERAAKASWKAVNRNNQIQRSTTRRLVMVRWESQSSWTREVKGKLELR